MTYDEQKYLSGLMQKIGTKMAANPGMSYAEAYGTVLGEDLNAMTDADAEEFMEAWNKAMKGEPGGFMMTRAKKAGS
jgi:hypothetical protein